MQGGREAEYDRRKKSRLQRREMWKKLDKPHSCRPRTRLICLQKPLKIRMRKHNVIQQKQIIDRYNDGTIKLIIND